MTLTQLKATLRKYRLYIAFGVLALFVVLVVGVIYYIRQAQEPLAPTAPTSKPSASENVCSTSFVIGMECTDLNASSTLQKGLQVSFTCDAIVEPDTVTYRYKDAADGQWKDLATNNDLTSAQITVGDYLEVQCTPCVGDLCAPTANVEEDCALVYEAPPAEEVACLDLETNGTLEQGQDVSFDCLAQNADTYTFEYKDTTDGSFQSLGETSTSSQSAQLTVGEYLEARCTPCQGDQCASATEIEQNCSVAYEAPPEEEELACVDLTSAETLDSGVTTTFTCAQAEGADSYRFEYRTSASADYQLLSEGVANNSTESLTVGEYLDVRCTPCADGACAPYISACALSFEAEEEEVTPQCDSECVNNADCPADLICSDGNCRNEECVDDADCTCDEEEVEEKAGFVIEKYNDLDGDGSRDAEEPGLDWEFKWDKNGDENWRDYVTYADEDGRGGNVDDLKPGDVIRIDEQAKSGWEATTVTDRTLTLQEGKRLLAQFGNWQPPADSTPTPTPTPTPRVTTQVTPTPTPTELPKSGSTSRTVGVLGVGVVIMLFGLYNLYVRRGL